MPIHVLTYNVVNRSVDMVHSCYTDVGVLDTFMYGKLEKTNQSFQSRAFTRDASLLC
jgi:hypothetical protein